MDGVNFLLSEKFSQEHFAKQQKKVAATKIQT